MNMLQRSPAPAITLQLLGCLTIVVLPHTPHLAPWIWLVFGAMVAWRAAAAVKHWPMPARSLRLFLGLAMLVAVYLTYGRINGQQGGIALLVALLGVKLTETQSLRDHVVVAMLAYFVLISQFLFSQELVMIAWLIAGAWLITATLLSISHPQSPLPYQVSIKRSASLLLQATPLMLLFFLLFPRIPGPIWGLPSDAGAGKSGLTDSMTPGDIGHLVTTDELAFRVEFKDNAPPPWLMYWRGPVFENFDGKTWRIARTGEKYPDPDVAHISLLMETNDSPIEYEVTLEPHRQHWLFALDMPVRGPYSALIQRDGLMLSKDKVKERRLYRAQSVLDYRLESRLPADTRQRNLRLPGGGNPRSRELARQWRAKDLSDEQIIRQALQRFRQQEYVYTLQAPTLGRDSVDEFLFDTRRGFCEHYAGSFAYLMRAAGIPARIITGYQGSELNALGDYYIVRQSDAHAWSEVWLEDQGWVRVDPTAAVAPSRIELGLQAALPVGEEMAAAIARRKKDSLWREMRMGWDLINSQWYRWVLGYGPDLQSDLLERFGLRGWGNMIIALTALGSVFLAVLGLMLVWQMRRPLTDDPVQRLWLRFCRRMARRGLARKSYEGPVDYTERLIRNLPGHKAQIKRIRRLYLRLRYGAQAEREPDSGSMQEFRQAVRDF